MYARVKSKVGSEREGQFNNETTSVTATGTSKQQ